MQIIKWIMGDTSSSEPKDVIDVLDFNKIYNKNKIISELRRLTLCSWSGMNFELDALTILAKTRKVNAKVITVTRENKMIGWALLSKEDSEFSFGKGNFIAERDGALFEIFVDPAYRRTGVGSALIKKARKHAGSAHLCVAPHDLKSNCFYDKHKKYKQKRLSW